MTAPRIITARELGLVFVDRFGTLGVETDVTGHHTAGGVDRDLAEAIAYARRYHREHAAKGWGGIGYHYMITRRGVLICLRPTVLKGAHVGGWNTGNIGIVCNGTTGTKPTRAQKRTYRWLLANAHTRRLPAAHRTDRDLRRARVRGHNDWPGHGSNACPATHKPMYLSRGR